MRPFTSEMLSLIPFRKPEGHLSRPLVCSKDLQDDCNRRFIRKTLFKSNMKEIAKNLEKAMMDFLNTDLLTKNWNYKAGPNKWSKKEIIGHLIDSAQINLQ